MPTLEFKGKYHIYAHHHSVPYRPLVADAAERECNPRSRSAKLRVAEKL